MRLLELYRRESETSGVPLLVMGTISGIAQAALLGIVTIAADTASYANLNFRYLCMFAIAFVVMFLSKRYALQQANVVIEQIIKKVRVRISDKIRNSELLFLERLGKGALYTRLTHDSNLVSDSAVRIISACQSVLVVVFCLGFVAVLSKAAFLITVGFLSLAVTSYFYHHRIVVKELLETKAKEAKFFEMINQILDGFKELKLNRKKSEDYFGVFRLLANTAEGLKINIGIRFITDLMFSQVSFYTILALIAFLLPWFGQIDSELIIRITAAVLFIIGPTNMVVGAIPIFIRANVTIGQLYTLEEQLDAISQATEELPVSSLTPFGELTFEDVEFSYRDEDDFPLFTVGPLNLTVRRGEILFLIGGNGSGKTTLLKLLTGFYYPGAGRIRLDTVTLEMPDYQAYRELFAIIFSDFHLFDRLYGIDALDDPRIDDLLHQMELEQKTQVVDGAFTDIDLSAGQRKRLAMIVALLDDRPIYVFDEWAADQDPGFRKYFYEELLQDLKTQGKTIIAVSHDDRYFAMADRVLKMEYGQFIDAGILA